MTITTLIRKSIEPRATALYLAYWQTIAQQVPCAWDDANETTKNRWRIRAWLETLKERDANAASQS